jgi:hypothetical protein
MSTTSIQVELTRLDYGPYQMAAALGVSRWVIDRAFELDLVPAADIDGARWSAAAVRALAERIGDIVDTVERERALGANRCAEQLAEVTGLGVERDDIETMAEEGLIRRAGFYKDWPLYKVADLDELDLDAAARIVAERQAWLAASLTRQEAAGELGWRLAEFERVAVDRGVEAGRFDRYARADVQALAGDDDLAEQVRADRLLGPNQAAEHLEIRRTDFDYVVAAGWLSAHEYVHVRVGRYREVPVPLYRVGDVEALLELPGVDWEEVRAVRPGEPSPLREFAHRPPTRAQVIRHFVADLAARYGVEAWAWYDGRTDSWSLDWELDPTGQPSVERIRGEIAAAPAVDQYASQLTVATRAGSAVRWARAMLEPGAAVLLDTETTDLYGAVCEVAVVDAATGEVLLDTLVNPGVPITPEAQWVHGIDDAYVTDAPTWHEILPRLLEVTKDRMVLAYNCEYDQAVICTDTKRHDLAADHLADSTRWGCVMNRRSDWNATTRRSRLGGGHRALGDALAALDVLRQMTAARTTRARL